MDDQHLTPAWVMCGAEIAPGRVALFASQDLTQAQLGEQVEQLSAWTRTGPIGTVRQYTLTTTMRNFVRIEASNWPDAFSALFAKWSPSSPGQARLELGRTAI